jgi:hypothetical protein
MAGALSSSLAWGSMATHSRTKPGPGPGGVESAPAPGPANETAVPASVEAPAGATNGPADSRLRAASSASRPSGSRSAPGGPLSVRHTPETRVETLVSALARRAFTAGDDGNEEEEEGTGKFALLAV